MPIPHALAAISSWIGVTASRIVANVASRIFTQPSKTSSVATQGKTQVAKRGEDQLRKAESDYLRGRAKREQDLVNIQADLAKMREIEVEAGMAIAAAQAEREDRALEISERELQLKQQAFQLAKQRLKQEDQIAEAQRQQVERALELRERELQILAEERAERIRLSYLHLQILQQNKAIEIDLHLNTIQANWDQENWSGVLSRAEMKHILLEGREKPRLLMLVSPPDIEGCSEFDINLHKDVRGELKSFIESYYPLDSDLCPVEFYGRFFKKSVFDIEVKQYEKDLAPIPTVIIYSDVTDKKIFFYIHYWGFVEGVPLTLSWNWREERDKLEAEGKTRDESNLIIRDAIAKIHQLLAAFWSDLHYLQVNPHHEVRLFQLDEDFPVEWAKSQFDALRDLQQQILENYKESLMSLPATPVNLSDPLPQEKKEITICFLGKTGSGKSTLINAFYNWCLGVDGRTKTERKYCITTRSQEGKKLEAEKQFAHLNTEDTQRTKGASSTKSPSRYTFETDELILHVVDTPGFADTSGLTTDREHMKQIIEKITQLNQVHIFGIVWNEKRLTAEQKFVVGCLQELLPKNSYKNIVVCVTNTLEADADTKDAIVAAGLEKCPLVCFDNLWVTAENWGRISLMFRNEAEASFSELIQYAKDAEPVSSVVFQSIKRKRKQLEDNRIQIFANIATLNDHRRALRVAIRELSDLSKDISGIKVKFTKVTPKETPSTWNTICSICGSNCHIGCGLTFKTQDYSKCSAMKSDGFCRECGHHYSVHTHQCTKWDREEIKEELVDSENLRRKQSKEEERKTRERMKQDLENKITSLDAQVEQQVKELRLVVDELSSLVMAPFNPHYLDYLETLKEAANQNGDNDIAKKFEHEIKDYTSFIALFKSGVDAVNAGIKSGANAVNDGIRAVSNFFNNQS